MMVLSRKLVIFMFWVLQPVNLSLKLQSLVMVLFQKKLVMFMFWILRRVILVNCTNTLLRFAELMISVLAPIIIPKHTHRWGYLVRKLLSSLTLFAPKHCKQQSTIVLECILVFFAVFGSKKECEKSEIHLVLYWIMKLIFPSQTDLVHIWLGTLFFFKRQIWNSS